MRIYPRILRRLISMLFCSVAMAPLAYAQLPKSNQPAGDTPHLEMVVLGSGGPGATGRAGSSYLVLLDSIPRILVDAGPGSFVRLGETGLSLSKTDLVLLTHLHIDHVGELPGLFKARAVSSRGAIAFHVFGPEGRRGKGGKCEFSCDQQADAFAIR